MSNATANFVKIAFQSWHLGFFVRGEKSHNQFVLVKNIFFALILGGMLTIWASKNQFLRADSESEIRNVKFNCSAVSGGKICNEYTTRTYRPLPESSRRDFIKCILQQKWDNVQEDGSPTQQVQALQEMLGKKK